MIFLIKEVILMFRAVVLLLAGVSFVLFFVLIEWIEHKLKERRFKKERAEAEKLMKQVLSDDGKDFY
ncbi:hypothetical protein KKF23_01300 [Patescibacteria group bacterium]|nr:hypothetical protein [Patescibacteria group bacterium]